MKKITDDFTHLVHETSVQIVFPTGVEESVVKVLNSAPNIDKRMYLSIISATF